MGAPETDLSGLTWVKATSSGVGECVEIAAARDNVAVRDSKHPQGPVLMYTRSEWRAFLDGVRKGEFDSFT